MLDLCVREIPSITIFWYKSGRNGQCLCWPGGSLCKVKDCVYNKSGFHFVPISFNKIAYKLTNEDREFLQFDFDKLLTEEIDIKNIKCFSDVSCIYNRFWWVDIVAEMNVHEGDLKIEFLHPHGPSKTFSWPSVADKCFVLASNILFVITVPTTITGRMYQISDTDSEETLKAYENHKMQPCMYKAVVHIWSFLSLGMDGFFFFPPPKFLTTHSGVTLLFKHWPSRASEIEHSQIFSCLREN